MESFSGACAALAATSQGKARFEEKDIIGARSEKTGQARRLTALLIQCAARVARAVEAESLVMQECAQHTV